MGRSKQIVHSDRMASTGGKDKFAMIFESMAKSEVFQSLSNAERMMYVYCRIQSRSEKGLQCLWKHGHEHDRQYTKDDFVFPDAHFKLYGLDSRNARKNMKVLTEKGFIKIKENNKARKQVNVYSFTDAWKK